MNKKSIALKRGFTLVELLIVIAILGALAAVVLVALNPVEQLARTRDSGRLNSVTSLGRSLEAYATSHAGSYVSYGAVAPLTYTWITTLVNAGEISTIPTNTSFASQTACTATIGSENFFCYLATTAGTGVGPVMVFTKAESKSVTSKCSTATPAAWLAYKSDVGRAGTVCTAAVGTVPTLASAFVD